MTFQGREVLSPAQIDLIYKLYPKKVKRNSVIEIIEFKLYNLLWIKNQNGYKQNISENTAYETRLLKQSQIDTDPREVLSFKVKHANGLEVEVPQLYFGKYNEVNFSAGEVVLMKMTHGWSSKIKEIQISHTHPIYDILVDQKVSIIHPLSLADLNLGKRFIKKIPINTSVLLKAIVPNGYFYWVRFRVKRFLFFIKIVEIQNPK